MDDAWARAVEAALENQATPRTLTLDGAVKCLHGRLPSPSLLEERFPDLEHLSIANTGVSYLDHFPRLRRLRRLILSDNRIAAGLDLLVAAELHSLRDLDLSNNRISSLDDLAPLSRLHLVSLDLYECPVTKIQGYREKLFVMIPSLKYLDKMDVDGNERPDSDDDDDEEEEDGEVDTGEERMSGNGESDDEEDDDYEEEDDDSGEETYEDVVDSSDEDDETEVEPRSLERLVSAEGEIDGHENGEDDDCDENGEEIGEDEELVGVDDLDSEDDGEGEDEEEDDMAGEYLVQPIPPQDRSKGADIEVDSSNSEEDEEDEVDNAEAHQHHLTNGFSLQPSKRPRDEEGDDDSSEEDLRSSKHH